MGATGGASRKRKTSLAKLIEVYYADLKELSYQRVLHEMGTRPAFHALLAAAGKEHGWTLIAEHEKKVNGRSIRPDGTFKDQMNLVRGYWEAKDTNDKLDAEIEKKRKAGYPLSNIIFEDTATGVLFQHGQRVLSVEMKDPAKLADLIDTFFQYIEPEIEEFEHAVDEFKERVPDLAEGLAKKIAKAHQENTTFKKAFADFFELCRTSLNPNLSQAAVDEMLIQHILTERLIREIFDNPEFVRRNVIAAEVEKVMQAMTSQSFDRNTYLKELDRFYIAIEHAARTMTDFSDKQYFLNTVYERFFQGYSVKLADTMGIVYTPQEIVDFMCASVAEVLEKEFGKKLWSDDVYIIDPCTGTGNFIVNLIRRIPKAKLEDVYKHRLFANEIMLLPYYIAALNIERAYWEQAGKYEAFEGLCFADTLDLAEHAQAQLGFMTAVNTQRVERQRRSPITVVIGNPPYNVGQITHNEQNANRSYIVVDGRVKETYSRDSSAKSRSKLADPYVKFFRWATDRLEGRDGIVCFVSNNSFVDQVTFDGMRKHLAKDFTHIYHLNLQGNVRQNPTLSGTQYNVFGIQVGVGITVAVRRAAQANRAIDYATIDKALRRENKLEKISTIGSISRGEWRRIKPDARSTWLVPANASKFSKFIPIATSAGRTFDGETPCIFKDFSLGVATHRDRIVYDFSSEALGKRVKTFADAYNVEVDRWKRAPADTDLDTFVSYDTVVWDADLKQNVRRLRYVDYSPDRIRRAFYRPFNKQWLYFDRLLNSRVYRFPGITPLADSEKENLSICCSDLAYRAKTFSTLIVDAIADLHLCATLDGHQCFPFYIYDEDGGDRRGVELETVAEGSLTDVRGSEKLRGSGKGKTEPRPLGSGALEKAPQYTRRENITDWALKQFQDHYKDKKIDKWAIFYYVYGVLHHPGYREKFADNLKRELPRIPFAPDFKAFAEAGKKLAKLHLNYEELKPWDLDFQEMPDEPLSYRVDDKMRLSKDKTRLVVNKSLTLAGIPPEAFEYRLGNRSALEWVIDQYQVSVDKRSGIRSDPNREDDPEYIVRLVGQVVRVSVETAKIVRELPGYE